MLTPKTKLKPAIFQKATELMKKIKKGSKNFWRVFQYKQNLNLPNTTSWQSCLDNPSIMIADVNKSVHWSSKSELGQIKIDKKNKDYCIEKKILRPTLTP